MELNCTLGHGILPTTKNTQGDILAVCQFGLTRHEENESHHIPKYGVLFFPVWQKNAGPTLCRHCVVGSVLETFNSRWRELDKRSQW